MIQRRNEFFPTIMPADDGRSSVKSSRGRRFALLLLSLLLPGFCGCDMIPWPENFGEVSGSNSTRSINGLGVYRRMWETTGARVLNPTKLSPRLGNIDTIVLVGRSYRPPGSLARDWLERWLAEKPGRTVVYFGRDFDASFLYREETLSELGEADRARARDELASSMAEQYIERNAQIPEDTFCRWFFLRTSQRPSVQTRFTGPWAEDLVGLQGSWPVGVLLAPPDSSLKNKQPSWITGTTAVLNPPGTSYQGADATEALGEKEIQRSIWKHDELSSSAAWDEEWDQAGEPEVLLAGESGMPLVYRITDSRFDGSQILVVANGLPFLNGSLVKPFAQKVSEKIIQECLPARRVAMIEYDQNGLLISNIESASETNVGMELLTLWPLSAITMHAAFLGIIAFAMLLPILGRPQKLIAQSVTNFGLHVDAMGNMLFETRDLRYGLTSIAEYFRRVRRETPPEWVTQMEASEAALFAEKQALAAAKAARRSKPTNTSPPDPVS